MRILLSILASLLAISLFAQDETYERLVYVYKTTDGDSYVVSNYVRTSDTTIAPLPYSKAYQVRLYGIDTPEQMNPYVGKEQPYARESSTLVRYMMTGQRVHLDSVGVDVYGRLVARVQLQDGTDLAKALAAGGIGWDYFPDFPRKASPWQRAYRDEIEALQKIARKENRGLFRLKGRKVRPETWRGRYPGMGGGA